MATARYVLLKAVDESTSKDEVDDDEDGPENDDLHIVSRVFLFFELYYKGRIMQLALVQTYPYLGKKKHLSGLHVLDAPEKIYKGNRYIIHVEDIERTALVVPNNDTKSTITGVPYHEYLVLHDIDRDCGDDLEYIYHVYQRESTSVGSKEDKYIYT